MKIAIVTLCEAVNYGAYLQAYSLKKYLEDKGNSVVFIKSYSYKMLKTTFKALYAYKPSKIKFKNEFRKNFKLCHKRFNKTFCKKGYDAVVIGSDEVWQLLNPTASPKPVFFGVGIEAKKKIAYAVCSNNTTYEDTLNYEYVPKGIKELDAVSVRDKETLSAYKKLIGDAEICLDPTFLIDIEKEATGKIDISEPYMLVYTYGFTDDKVKKVKEFANNRNLKIVSVGQAFSWADYSFPCSAFDFLSYIKSAEYVFTDTFHGTILSIQLEKELFSFGYKKKVGKALEQFGLEKRNITADSDLEKLSEEKINYSEVNKIISDYKKTSVDFIEKNIF